MPPIDLVFMVCAGISVGILLLTAFMGSSQLQAASGPLGMGRTAIATIRTPGIPHALITSSIVLASLDIFLAYAPALGSDRGLTIEVVSTMLVVRSIASMLSRLLLGGLMAALGRRGLLAGSTVVSAVALISLLAPLPALWVVVISAVYGFAIGTCQPITMAWVYHLAPPGTR